MRAPKMSARAGRAVCFSAVVVVIAAAGLLSRAAPGADASVPWYGQSSIESKTTHDSQSGTTHDITIRSEQHSDDCQDLYDEQANHANPDGSFHDTQDIAWSNGKGDSAHNHVTWDRDASGNLTRHSEYSWILPDGSRTTVWTDEVFDPSTGRYKWKDGRSRRDKIPPLSEPQKPESGRIYPSGTVFSVTGQESYRQHARYELRYPKALSWDERAGAFQSPHSGGTGGLRWIGEDWCGGCYTCTCSGSGTMRLFFPGRYRFVTYIDNIHTPVKKFEVIGDITIAGPCEK